MTLNDLFKEWLIEQDWDEHFYELDDGPGEHRPGEFHCDMHRVAISVYKDEIVLWGQGNVRSHRFQATDPKCFNDLRMALLNYGFSLSAA